MLVVFVGEHYQLNMSENGAEWGGGEAGENI